MQEKPLVPWAKEKLFLCEQSGYPVPAQVAYQITEFTYLGHSKSQVEL